MKIKAIQNMYIIKDSTPEWQRKIMDECISRDIKIEMKSNTSKKTDPIANGIIANFVRLRNCVDCPVMNCDREFLTCRQHLLSAAASLLDTQYPAK